MSACDVLIENASGGAGPALRAVDCLANETAAAAFGRLFGTQGALLPALTILLTLFIAFFALSLLTGRSQLSIAALTPRMMTLGVVLTLATSWIAWQGLIWNLAVGAPDQVAGILLGAKGSATQLFADRIDMVFAAITEAGDMNGGGATGAAQAAQGSFTPPNLMWLGAVMLLLGTVGILVTARIALAVLMAVGPVFVIMALFSGTRGLTAGWLRGLVLTAVTPLFVVAGGSMILELLVPVVVKLRGAEGIDPRAAMALFLIASVHIALMAMVMKVSGTIVSAWQVFGLASDSRDDARSQRGDAPAPTAPLMANATAASAGSRSRTAVMMTPSDASASGHPVNSPATARGGRTIVNHVQPGVASGLPPLAPKRARGIGSRFAAKPSPMREMMR
jgi:type IV secretion system protein VirB6